MLTFGSGYETNYILTLMPSRRLTCRLRNLHHVHPLLLLVLGRRLRRVVLGIEILLFNFSGQTIMELIP